jgi:hypothetical protein
MAHNSFGVDDPVAIIPVSPTPGYGEYPGAEIADDGDDRDAASAMMPSEALLDRTNFLAWRMINIIEGGVYAFTSLIDIANRWTMRGRIKLLGTLAWFGHRAPIHINGANAIFTVTNGDTFVLDTFTHGATRIYSFAPASDAPALYRFRIRSEAVPPTVDGSSGSADSFTNSGTILFKLDTGNRAFLQYAGGTMDRNRPWCVDCEYDAGLGMIYVVGGEPTSTGLSRPIYAP